MSSEAKPYASQQEIDAIEDTWAEIEPRLRATVAERDSLRSQRDAAVEALESLLEAHDWPADAVNKPAHVSLVTEHARDTLLRVKQS